MQPIFITRAYFSTMLHDDTILYCYSNPDTWKTKILISRKVLLQVKPNQVDTVPQMEKKFFALKKCVFCEEQKTRNYINQ